MVQWLRPDYPYAGGPGLISGLGTGSVKFLLGTNMVAQLESPGSFAIGVAMDYILANK